MIPSIILASGSEIRAKILIDSGVSCVIYPADIDEKYYKDNFKKSKNIKDSVETLAELKALHVSKKYADKIVIGADQILECDGIWFDKPENTAQAKEHIKILRNKTHNLVSGVAVVKNGECIWSYSECVKMTMRDFSDDFLDYYIESTKNDICSSVGAYQLEGIGSQLFSKIEGCYFSILGLPLIPLLKFLRSIGVLKT